MNSRLKELIQEVLDDEGIETQITEDSEFIDDLELSSLAFFHLITIVENTFNIKISDREVQELETVGELAEIVEERA